MFEETDSLVVRHPWMVASVLSGLLHLPFFVVELPSAAPPAEVITLDLLPYVPPLTPSADEPVTDEPASGGDAPAETSSPTVPPPAEPRPTTSERAPPVKPAAPTAPVAPNPPQADVAVVEPPPPDVPVPEEPTSVAPPAFEPSTAPSEPAVAASSGDVAGGTKSGRGAGTDSGTGTGDGVSRGTGTGGSGSSATPPRTLFDPRAYRGLAFAHVDRHKRYPRKARVLKQEGEVLVLIALDAEGRLMREPTVQRSSGVDALDEEAVRMVKAAVPFPKPEGEVSRVPILVPLTIRFRLEDP